MMKKQIIFGGLLCATTLILGACGTHDSKSTHHHTSPKTENVEETDSSSMVESSKLSSSISSTVNESSLVADNNTEEMESSANAQSTENVAQSNQTVPNVTNKQLGVMIGLLQSPDWFKGGLSSGEMYYGTVNDTGGEVTGYNFISANGDPESYIYYKRNGDVVTIKYVDPKPGQTVADAGMATRTISYNDLLQDYYQNSNQQTEVNNDASQLKDE